MTTRADLAGEVETAEVGQLHIDQDQQQGGLRRDVDRLAAVGRLDDINLERREDVPEHEAVGRTVVDDQDLRERDGHGDQSAGWSHYSTESQPCR